MNKIDGEDVFGAVIIAAVIGVIALIGGATYGAIKSNGETDYCYVEMISPTGMAPQFQLEAHRPWRADRVLGAYPTIDEAKAKADGLCKVGQR